MSEEKSIFRKTETAFDDLVDLWRRRKLVCIIVLAVMVLPAGFTLYQQYVAMPKLKDQVTTLERQKRETEQERDKADLRLAPFLAAAERRFPDTPADQRLDLLLSKLDKAITDVQTAARKVSPERSIDPQMKQSLVANLKPISPLDVEITCVLGDTEGFALASQLKEVFQQAGWKVNGVNQSVFTTPIKRLVLSFGKEPSSELQSTLGPLFDSLGYPREAGLNKELGENSLRILVGSK
jgi:hypothetical protein